MPTLLAFFGIGTYELIAVMIVVLLLFGNRLPGVMRSMGRGIKEFKEGINDPSSNDDDDADEQAPKKKAKENPYSDE